MNAIIGMTNIARTAKDLAKKEYCLEKIDQASKHLLGVINDILDMSKIEANKFELYLHEFNLESMLMNIMNVVTFRAEEKRQNLIVWTPLCRFSSSATKPGCPKSLPTCSPMPSSLRLIMAPLS